MNNPFTVTFGKKPPEYIVRHEIIDNITSAFTDEPARCQTYLIQGVKGSGKTVLMTAISKQMSDKGWVCVDLNSTQNLIQDFSYRLSDACRSIGDIFERGVDISVAGFGFGIGEKDSRDSVSQCENILESVKKKGKKILITIDEVSNDTNMKQFASQFQIWIRKEYPIFLLMTGLYENLNAIQNNPQLTFLLRSPKVSLGPLGVTQINRVYENALQVKQEQASMLARITKGYAFAFQALGMLYWDAEEKNLDNILCELDNYLDEYVYQKVWQDLSDNDKKIMKHIPDDQPIKTAELCDKADMTPQVFSKYRERLINRGLIHSTGHGYVEQALPRFNRISRYYWFEGEI